MASYGNGRSENREMCRFQKFEGGARIQKKANMLPKIRKRRPHTKFRKMSEQNHSSGIEQIRQASNYSESDYFMRGRQNRQRYEDYEEKGWPYSPTVDYSGNWIRGQMYANAMTQNEEGGGFSGPRNRGK